MQDVCSRLHLAGTSIYLFGSKTHLNFISFFQWGGSPRHQGHSRSKPIVRPLRTESSQLPAQHLPASTGELSSNLLLIPDPWHQLPVPEGGWSGHVARNHGDSRPFIDDIEVYLVTSTAILMSFCDTQKKMERNSPMYENNRWIGHGPRPTGHPLHYAFLEFR